MRPSPFCAHSKQPFQRHYHQSHRYTPCLLNLFCLRELLKRSLYCSPCFSVFTRVYSSAALCLNRYPPLFTSTMQRTPSPLTCLRVAREVLMQIASARKLNCEPDIIMAYDFYGSKPFPLNRKTMNVPLPVKGSHQAQVHLRLIKTWIFIVDYNYEEEQFLTISHTKLWPDLD